VSNKNRIIDFYGMTIDLNELSYFKCIRGETEYGIEIAYNDGNVVRINYHYDEDKRNRDYNYLRNKTSERNVRMARKIVDFNGTAVDVSNIKYFEKVDKNPWESDNPYGVKLIFWDNATKTIWYNGYSKMNRDNAYNWLINNI
jgi:hypothetical protein